jgi:hypothetical protein
MVMERRSAAGAAPAPEAERHITRRGRSGAERAGPTTAPTTAHATGAVVERRLLTPEEINIIRRKR